MTLFLCFYGDSALWDNTLLIPGYPSGYSYFRPFRYRDEWIQKDLLKEIQNEQLRNKLKSETAILYMRFSAPKEGSVLPVRKVVIRHIDPMSDNQSIYFSMGRLYDFTKVKDLSDICLDIGKTERDTVGGSLFFRTSLPISLEKCKDETLENEAWIRFVDLVANEEALPIRSEAKQSLFIRFQGLGSKEPAEKGIIHKSWTSGEIDGTILTEGSSYELVFYHRVPALIGRKVSLKKSLIKYKAPTGNLELNRSEEELTGNYQKHVLNVSALKPSGTWEEIIIEPSEKVESQDGEKIYAANAHIPLKVKISHWYRFKKIYLWLILVWVTLFANAIVSNLLNENTDEKTNWNLIIISAVIAVGSAIGVYVLAQRTTSK